MNFNTFVLNNLRGQVNVKLIRYNYEREKVPPNNDLCFLKDIFKKELNSAFLDPAAW